MGQAGRGGTSWELGGEGLNTLLASGVEESMSMKSTCVGVRVGQVQETLLGPHSVHLRWAVGASGREAQSHLTQELLYLPYFMHTGDPQDGDKLTDI